MKKLTSKLHLWLGLISGLVVFIVSLTGCLYVFEEEIRDYSLRQHRFVKPVENQAMLGIDSALSIARSRFPEQELRQLRSYTNSERAWQLVFEDKKMASLNPYTGETGPLYSSKDWLYTVEKLHVSLLLGEAGKWIIRVNILIFLFLLISGIVLWWPRNKARLKQAFRPQWKGSFKRVNYDLHSILGFYASWVLLIITLTGMWWSFDWTKQLVYAAVGERWQKPKPILSGEANPATSASASSGFFAQLAAMYPGYEEAHIHLPAKEKESIKLRLHYKDDWYRRRNEIFIDQYSYAVLATQLYSDYHMGEKIKHANYNIHTGKVLGLFGKIIAFMASLFAASLPISGFLIWYGRYSKKSTAHKKAQVRTHRPAAQPKAPRALRTPARVA